MKIICIHHRLAGFTSHHFNEAYGLMRDFERRRKELIMLVNIDASAQIGRELNAFPVLDDPTFRLEWSFEERSRRFREMLHKHVDRRLNGGDWVLITVATQLEADALTRWLQELPRRKKPWIIILFLSDRWNRAGRDEYDRQVAEFRILKSAITSLTSDDTRRMLFFTLTDLLAEELSELLGAKVDVAPIPLHYGVLPLCDRYEITVASTPRIAILGGARREKGSYLIPDIVRACQSRVHVEFLVQLINNTLTAEEFGELTLVADEPRVSVIREAMPLTDYQAALNSSDIALFPYEPNPYRKRTSGVFGEAVAFGKPVVVTAGTWMAEQIEAGRAAGTISEDLRPDSIADAVARCVADLDRLQPSAQALSSEWRSKVSLPAFVDLIETEVALRSQLTKPSRWFFWPA